MNEMILVKPTIEYEEQIRQLRQEILDAEDKDAFAGCDALKKVYYEGSWQEWETLVPDNLAVGLSGKNVTPDHVHDTTEPENREVFRAPKCHITKIGLGYYSDIYCADCGTVYIPYKSIKQLAHTFPKDENGEYIYTAKEEYTCEELDKGLLKYSTCSVCGISAETALTEDEAEDVLITHDWKIIALINEKGEAVSCDDLKSEAHYLSRICAYCDIEDDELAYKVTEHKADGEYKKVVEADCVTDGYTEYACAICKNKFKVDKESKWGHDFEWIVEKEPTCKVDGLEVETCKTCGATAERQYIGKVECKAIIDEEKSVAPTCTTVGVNYYKCEMCNGPLDEKTENLDALGHSESYELVYYPDCTEGGVKVTKCAHEGCNEIKQENIPKGQHAYEEKYFAPACEGIGYKAVVCTACGDEKKDSRVDDKEAADHTWTEWEVLTEASCGVNEVQVRYCIAENCPKADESLKNEEDEKAHLFKETKETEKTALEHKWSATKDPDFCHLDEDIIYVCDICEAEKIVTYKGVGHTNIEDVIAPTCTTEGYTIFTCQKCPSQYVGDFVPELGHDMGEWEVKTAETCDTAGEKVRYCKTEDCRYSETEKIEATGHKAIPVNAIPATCEKTGVSEYYIYCSVCKAVLNRDGTVVADKKIEDYVISAKGHTAVKDAAVAATCTETGLTEGSHCAVCKNVIVAQNEVAVLGHDMDEWKTVKAATCETAGEMECECSREDCGHVETKAIPATGHTEVKDLAIAPTCTESGFTEGSHCFVCNKVLVAQEEVSALGHKAISKASVAPTCTETGLTAGSYCSVCKATIVLQKVVPATGHNTNDWVIVKNPTCDMLGEKERTCLTCGEIEKAEVEKTEHDYSEWKVVKEATAFERGVEERECSDCFHEETRAYELTFFEKIAYIFTAAFEGIGSLFTQLFDLILSF